MKNTRTIRLEWNTDEGTFDDYIVPIDLSKTDIQEAIDIALAYNNDESGHFVKILAKKGFDVNLVAVKDKEIFDFNTPKEEKYFELECTQLDEVVKLKEKTNKLKSNTKETKEIRLEWNTYEYTFDDYTVSADLPNEIIQEAIDIAIAYSQDASGYFVRIIRGRGFEVNLIAVKDKEIFDFITPKNDSYEEMGSNKLDKIVDKFKPVNNEKVKKPIV